MLKTRIAFASFVLILFIQCEVFAQTESVAGAVRAGKVIESRYCTIFCHPDVDIKKVDRRISVNPSDRMFFGDHSLASGSIEDRLAEKVDYILHQVQSILDMYPKKMHLKVNIYKDQKQLDEVYAGIFGQSNKDKFISYYVHKYTTIYTTQQAISKGLLSHEMGHAVVDHYFLILPPENIKEILSQYVEIHLED